MLHSYTGDYRSGPWPYTAAVFSSESTGASFYITIIDDNVVEDNEEFVLQIDPLTLPVGVSLNGRSQATVTISNDDCEQLYTFVCWTTIK